MRFKPPVLSEGVEKRFWKYVDRSGECWVWTGALLDGYGVLGLGRRGQGTALAHRISFALAGRQFTGDGLIRHTCDNRPCVRPDHLLSGTYADNSADAKARGRTSNGVRVGESHHRARWTDDQVRAMCSAYMEGESQVSIARRFGGSKSNIGRIVRLENWKHVTQDLNTRNAALDALADSLAA